jgi:hypothetical protein
MESKPVVITLQTEVGMLVIDAESRKTDEIVDWSRRLPLIRVS